MNTIAKALHRALFLPGSRQTGGSVLDAMKSDPFMADPEVELAFSCRTVTAGPCANALPGNPGQRVSLQDSEAGGLQGEGQRNGCPADWYGSCVPAPVRRLSSFKERWGHLCGVAGILPATTLSRPAQFQLRPMTACSSGCRPVPTWAVQSPLIWAVLDDIPEAAGLRCSQPEAGNRTPQVRKGFSPLQRGRRRRRCKARNDLKDIGGDACQQQQGFQQAFDQAGRHSGTHGLLSCPLQRRAPGPFEGRLRPQAGN